MLCCIVKLKLRGIKIIYIMCNKQQIIDYNLKGEERRTNLKISGT